MSSTPLGARLTHAVQADCPVISQHAHAMWDHRMPCDAVAPETALEHAHGLQDVTTHGHWERDPDPPDVVWVYRGLADGRAYTAALIERNGCITTALRASEMSHRPMAAYLREAARQRGGHYE